MVSEVFFPVDIGKGSVALGKISARGMSMYAKARAPMIPDESATVPQLGRRLERGAVVGSFVSQFAEDVLESHADAGLVECDCRWACFRSPE